MVKKQYSICYIVFYLDQILTTHGEPLIVRCIKESICTIKYYKYTEIPMKVTAVIEAFELLCGISIFIF